MRLQCGLPYITGLLLYKFEQVSKVEWKQKLEKVKQLMLTQDLHQVAVELDVAGAHQWSREKVPEEFKTWSTNVLLYSHFFIFLKA